MLATSDDGQFGFLVTKLAGRQMFRFQLIINGRLIGDQEPCIIGSAMAALGDLPCLDDQRLDLLSSDPKAVVSLLDSDADLHDAATLSIAESLDSWWLRGYVRGGNVVLLTRRRRQGQAVGDALISVVPLAEYQKIYKVAHDYWLNASESMEKKTSGPVGQGPGKLGLHG